MLFGITFAFRRVVPVAVLLATLTFLALIWIGLALGIKRLHDRDKSGWWLLLFYFVPSVLETIGAAILGSGAMFILGSIGAGISIWGLIEIGFLRGTSGQNSYGPDPLAGPGSA